MRILLEMLKPHPLNQKIYGDDDQEEFNELLEKIKESQWISPLQIAPDYTILAGHRRYRVAKLLGWEKVEVEIINCEEEKQLEILLLSNAYREKKTNLQKLREAALYRRLTEKRAADRRIEAGLQNIGQSPVGDSRPPLEETGKTRDIIGEKVGLSGRSIDRGMKVIKLIDESANEATKFFFEDAVNRDITAASKLAEHPAEVIQNIIEEASGKTLSLTELLVNLEKPKEKEFPLPQGTYQVIYCDLTVPYIDEIFGIPISTIGEANSVVFVWALPNNLGEAIKLIESWGFKYEYCWVWNKAFVDEFTDNAEILIIASKGKPAIIKGSEFENGLEKPTILKKKIYSTYGGSKVEIQFGNGKEGWSIWSDLD